MERNLRVSRFRREQDGRLEGAGHEAREGAVAAGHGIEGVVGGTDGDARRYPAYEHIRSEMRDMMFESLRRRRTRTTRDETFMRMRSERSLARKTERPVFLGVW